MDWAVAIEAAGKTVPALVNLVGSLIAMGHSPDDAAEIVKRDLKSRQAEYEAAKAEDERRLREKHGQD